MKICLFTHSLESGGGVQQVVKKLTNEWSLKGHEVTILCPVKPKNIVKLSSSIEIIYLLNNKNFKLREFYKLVFPMRDFFNSRSKFDVLVVNEVFYCLSAIVSLFLSKCHVKLVCISHGTYKVVGGFKQSLVSLLSVLALNICSFRVNGFVGVCNDVIKDVEKSIVFLKGKKFSRIYNPVIDKETPLLKEVAKHKLLNDSNEKIVVSVGRLHKQKGFDLLIKSIPYCNDNIRFIIVGEGEEYDNLLSLAVKLNVKERVEFVGYHPNVFEILAIADCFCLSSRWEGFGVVLVEALYAQLPIVSFACPHGPREVLSEGRYGELVECYDIYDLAEKINLSVNQGVNKNIRWKDFTVEFVANEYIKFFSDL